MSVTIGVDLVSVDNFQVLAALSASNTGGGIFICPSVCVPGERQDRADQNVRAVTDLSWVKIGPTLGASMIIAHGSASSFFSSAGTLM